MLPLEKLEMDIKKECRMSKQEVVEALRIIEQEKELKKRKEWNRFGKVLSCLMLGNVVLSILFFIWINH